MNTQELAQKILEMIDKARIESTHLGPIQPDPIYKVLGEIQRLCFREGLKDNSDTQEVEIEP